MSEKVFTFKEAEFRKFLFGILEAREDNDLDDPKTVDFAVKMARKMNFTVPVAAIEPGKVTFVAAPVARVEMSQPQPKQHEDPCYLTKKGLV